MAIIQHLADNMLAPVSNIHCLSYIMTSELAGDGESKSKQNNSLLCLCIILIFGYIKKKLYAFIKHQKHVLKIYNENKKWLIIYFQQLNLFKSLKGLKSADSDNLHCAYVHKLMAMDVGKFKM